MANTLTELTVLVASPGDVAEERNSVKRVVEEVNDTLRADHGIVLKPLMWELDAVPNIGVSAQDEINRQLADNADIVIGIFWTRLGTPTQNAKSGTVEEIGRALERLEQDPGAVRISLFHSAIPCNPKKLDLAQLQAMREFLASMQPLGFLKEYPGISQFELSLRGTLQKHAREWGKEWGNDRSSPMEETERSLAMGAGLVTDDEEGLLDAVENAESHLGVAAEAMERLVEAINDLNDRVSRSATDMGEVDYSQPDGLRRAKRIANAVADYLDAFAQRSSAETKLLGERMRRSIDSFSAAIAVSIDFDSPERDESLLGSRKAMTDLAAQMEFARNGASEMRQSIMLTPRMTTKLNRSKRQATQALSDFVEMVEDQIALIDVAVQQIDEVLLADGGL